MAVTLVAQIDQVEITEPDADDGSVMKQGLNILKTRLSFMGGGQHAVYVVRVQRNDQYYTVKKRFSEFAAFHEFLKGRFGPALPFDLPSKTAVRQFGNEKLEDRKNALNAYLKEICRRQEFLSCPEVIRFLEPRGVSSSVPPPAPPAAGPREATSTGVPVSTFNGRQAAQSAAPPPMMSAPAAPARPLVAGAAPGATVNSGADSDDDLAGWDR